jgi:hypothetical protein
MLLQQLPSQFPLPDPLMARKTNMAQDENQSVGIPTNQLNGVFRNDVTVVQHRDVRRGCGPVPGAIAFQRQCQHFSQHANSRIAVDSAEQNEATIY